MAGIGDSAPRQYVTDELIRRTIGLNGRRHETQYANDPKITNCAQWHNTKRPWIRLVSNAVPYENANLSSEYKDCQDMFNEDPTDNTRFRHVLWGGIGQFDPEEKQVSLANTFQEKYVNPFNTDTLHFTPKEQRGIADGTAYRPMPGITGANITYKGDMGALKKATIDFKCYTMGDLERLEKLYMYPGIRLLCEWGWSINTADEAAERTSVPITPMELDAEKLKYPSQIYNHIQKSRYESGGCYDGMFGTITNFNWSINSDLSFDCSVNISDFGDSIFTINVNTPFKAGSKDLKSKDGLTLTSALEDIHKGFAKGSIGKNNKITEESIKLDQIGTFKAKIYKLKTGTTSKAVGDKGKTDRKKQLYIRFGDIVDRLCNRLYALTSDPTRSEVDNDAPATAIAMFSIGGSNVDQDAGLSNGAIETVLDPTDVNKVKQIIKQPVSIISNHKGLLSCDPDICLLPNQIGEDPYTVVKEAKSAYASSKYVPTGLKGEGCDFNVPKAAADLIYTDGDYGREGEYGAGFLANIFINFDILLSHAETASSIQDFLQNITTDINNACGNIWAFQWQMLDEYCGFVTCLDRNFTWSGKVQALELAVDSASSIVKSLSMKSNISSQMVNALYIAANGPFTGTSVKVGEMQSKNIIPLDVDFSIDGVSGIQFGTTFSIDYLPKRYRDQTYLFAKQVQHSITPQSWDTTITAGFRYAPLEGTLQKIKLRDVPKFLGSPTDQMRLQITQDNDIQDDGAEEEKVYGNEKIYPKGIFYSAESKDLTMGGDKENSIEGMDVSTSQGKQEAKVDQEEALSIGLSRTYTIGSNDKDVSENLALLKDIINKVAEEGGAAEPIEKVGENKSTTRKVVTPKKQVKTDFTKVMGSSTYDGPTTDVPPPRFKGKLFAPPGFNPPPPSQTFVGPSDIRLKTNIEKVGNTEYGIPLYEFNYKNMLNLDYSGRYRGVMAQDLLETDMAKAVITNDNGYYSIDYNQLDINLEKVL